MKAGAWIILMGWVCAVCVGVANAGDVAGDANTVASPVDMSFPVAVESVQVSTRSIVDDIDGALVYGPPERTVTIVLRYELPDVNKPVAIDTYPPAVLGAWDGLGQEVAFQTKRTSDRREYERMRRTLVSEGGGSVLKYVPSGITIDLVLDPNQPVPATLSRIEGTICALYAEDVIEGDIPFEVTGEWIDINEAIQISVSPTTPPAPGPIKWELIPGTETAPRGERTRPAEPIALWMYDTYVRSTAGSCVLTLDMPWNPGRTVSDYVLIKTGLVSTDGTFMIPFHQFASAVSDGCDCIGQLEQDTEDYDTIRHVLAVHPVEVRVPFVLTNVPVPAL